MSESWNLSDPKWLREQYDRLKAELEAGKDARMTAESRLQDALTKMTVYAQQQEALVESYKAELVETKKHLKIARASIDRLEEMKLDVDMNVREHQRVERVRELIQRMRQSPTGWSGRECARELEEALE